MARRQTSLTSIISRADRMISSANDLVTEHIRDVLIQNGFSEEVAHRYCASYCSGGEWILDTVDHELCREDIQLTSDESIVTSVRIYESELF